MNKKLIGLALLLTLATALGACQPSGGDGGSSPGSSPAASPSPGAS